MPPKGGARKGGKGGGKGKATANAQPAAPPPPPIGAAAAAPVAQLPQGAPIDVGVGDLPAPAPNQPIENIILPNGAPPPLEIAPEADPAAPAQQAVPMDAGANLMVAPQAAQQAAPAEPVMAMGLEALKNYYDVYKPSLILSSRYRVGLPLALLEVTTGRIELPPKDIIDAVSRLIAAGDSGLVIGDPNKPPLSGQALSDFVSLHSTGFLEYAASRVPEQQYAAPRAGASMVLPHVVHVPPPPVVPYAPAAQTAAPRAAAPRFVARALPLPAFVAVPAPAQAVVVPVISQGADFP